MQSKKIVKTNSPVEDPSKKNHKILSFAEEMVRLKDYKNALISLGKFKKRNKLNAEFRFKISILYENMGDIAAALRTLGPIVGRLEIENLNHFELMCQLRLCRLLSKLGAHNWAFEHFELLWPLLQKDKLFNKSQGLRYRGDLNMRQYDFTKAAQFYFESFRNSDHKMLAYLEGLNCLALVDSLEASGQIEEAQAILEQIEKSPVATMQSFKPLLLQVFGEFYLRTGKLDLAAKFLDQAKEYYPHSDDVGTVSKDQIFLLRWTAILQWRLGQSQDAANTLEKGLQKLLQFDYNPTMLLDFYFWKAIMGISDLTNSEKRLLLFYPTRFPYRNYFFGEKIPIWPHFYQKVLKQSVPIIDKKSLCLISANQPMQFFTRTVENAKPELPDLKEGCYRLDFANKNLIIRKKSANLKYETIQLKGPSYHILFQLALAGDLGLNLWKLLDSFKSKISVKPATEILRIEFQIFQIRKKFAMILKANTFGV